jgi:hypothetical protein
MVDTAGTKEPVRVTFSAGFDGLCHRRRQAARVDVVARGRIRRSVVLGQWNHEKALEAIAEAPLKRSGTKP